MILMHQIIDTQNWYFFPLPMTSHWIYILGKVVPGLSLVTKPRVPFDLGSTKEVLHLIVSVTK